MTLAPLTPNAPQTAWRIVGQQETTSQGPDGRIGPGYQIAFTTEKGVRGTVFVPRDMYSPDNVRAIVAAQAYQIDQVQGMTGV